MRPLNTKVLNGSTLGDLASAPIAASQLFSVSLQAVVATAGTGVLHIQVSNDSPLANPPTTWSDLATVATTGAGTYQIVKTDLCAQWMRVTYVHTSGSGTVIANLQALSV